MATEQSAELLAKRRACDEAVAGQRGLNRLCEASRAAASDHGTCNFPLLGQEGLPQSTDTKPSHEPPDQNQTCAQSNALPPFTERLVRVEAMDALERFDVRFAQRSGVGSPECLAALSSAGAARRGLRSNSASGRCGSAKC